MNSVSHLIPFPGYHITHLTVGWVIQRRLHILNVSRKSFLKLNRRKKLPTYAYTAKKHSHECWMSMFRVGFFAPCLPPSRTTSISQCRKFTIKVLVYGKWLVKQPPPLRRPPIVWVKEGKNGAWQEKIKRNKRRGWGSVLPLTLLASKRSRSIFLLKLRKQKSELNWFFPKLGYPNIRLKIISSINMTNCVCWADIVARHTVTPPCLQQSPALVNSNQRSSHWFFGFCLSNCHHSHYRVST